MKLHQLQALVAVVDAGGIRAAARSRNVSQAAITKALRELEADAATPLVLRRSAGVGLTDAGRRLLAHARLVTRQMALAEEELRQAAGEDMGSLRVGLVPLLTMTVLPEAFNWLRQRYRQVQLQLTEGLVARVVPALRDGTLDLAVVALDDARTLGHGVVAREIAHVGQCVVARSGHPLHRASRSTPRLEDCEWLVTTSDLSDAGVRLAAAFASAGLGAPRRMASSEAIGTLALLRHTDCVSVLPRMLLGRPETAGIREVADCPLPAPELRLVLLQRAETPLTPAAEYFAHCLEVVSRRVAEGPARARGRA